MATLVLGAAGAALGAVFGGPGAILGRAAGALAGATLDASLFGARRKIVGPRLTELSVQGSTEGAAIPRLYGKARLAGQIIWATDFEEVRETDEESSKGGPRVTTTEYSYFGNFAVALCEGEIAGVGRIWADGNLIDQSLFTFRMHPGSEDQLADSLILAKQNGVAPSYRGTAHVVFERMPLGAFGNRIPQLSFEVLRPVAGIEDHVKAVCVIPGSTEFGYDPLPVTRSGGSGSHRAENTHALRDVSDWTVSIDALQAICPKLKWVTLIVAWFGDDLRADSCTIRPKVDDLDKVTRGATWQVAGLTRATATRVSLVDGRPAYGGSPSDASVVRAIADLKARGLKVVLAPFVLMDIPPENGLPDPRTGAVDQPAFPWRGEITCNPGPGRPGTPDKTAAASGIVTAFLGAAEPGHFTISDDAIAYAGPAEWRYRRLILHYAKLSALAGGVDGFLIGSELRGLTALRSSSSAYPFVAGLKALAADVRSVIGTTPALSYAADWSEYFGHQPDDGSGDVHFHLDPLWADAHVDFVGIDLYHPLTDWRDAPDHADAAGGRSPYDRAYLRSNIRGGEGFDWFYASAADRAAQVRTPITDGAAGKPWVFRFKDIEAWWSNPHHDRPGGVESASATAWQPKSKPVWLTELGCPAVDKGANQPNVFFDPKSAQSALPHFSSGTRDDLAQRSYVDAYQRFFDPQHPEFSGSNPISPVYGGRMIPPEHVHLWAWDARPHPHFPDLADVWSDGANWERGHWLNGRLGAATLAALIEAILADHEFSDYTIDAVHGLVGGYIVNDILSARGTLEPLLQAFRNDASDAGDRIRFRGRSRPADALIGLDQLVERPDEPALARRRAQETELASELILRFVDAAGTYRMAAAAARRLAADSRRTAAIDLAAILDSGDAERLSEALLRDIWAGRESVDLVLPPSASHIEAGDVLSLPGASRPEILIAERIEDALIGAGRSLRLRRIDNQMPPGRRSRRRPPPEPAPIWGPPEVRIVDFAPPDGNAPHAPRMAVFADPWPGAIAVHAGTVGGGFRLAATIPGPAVIGNLAAPLQPGPLSLFDPANIIEVTLLGGALAGLPDIDVLAGGNAAAIRTADGRWEILQFAAAELIGPRRYRLRRLLRGQCGSEQAMQAGAAEGADFVLLNKAVVALPIKADALGRPLRYRFGPAADDHAAPSFTELTVTAEGVGLTPFAPVHLRAYRNAVSGTVELAWIRRTRFGGDSWAAADVPLNEEREAYKLEIRDAGQLRRSVETAAPSYSYTAASQITDLGGPTSFEARIFQLSATAGQGAPLQRVVDV